MKIKVRCFTNLNEYKSEKWPTEFQTVPQRGDWVQSLGGKILKIVNFTHTVEGYVLVELHKV